VTCFALTPTPFRPPLESAGIAGRTRALKISPVGWAIGSLGWRRKLAEENRRLVLASDLEREEVAEIREKMAQSNGGTEQRGQQRSFRQA
jgi:hypothetical protein